MTPKRRIQYTLLMFLGLLAVVAFGIFWFSPHNLPTSFHGKATMLDVLLFICVTYVIWLPIFMKLLLWAISSYVRPLRPPGPPNSLRVAFVTTFVPASESLSLLKKSLPAMVNVKYPHDTWLLDEGDDPEAKILCARLGVKHFSRANKSHYHMPEGKFATKTKAGNHNSWYDHIGHKYDIVAQMDTDFVPREDFLLKTLGYFNDPKVAFVGTPQIYGNDADSLIARGAAEQTYHFYGPLLRGMDGMDTTLLIGANHVIRVKALESVGHYSPHITEDLITGMRLHSKGWTSIYVPEALAIGEGPVTWKAFFDQQKRWAYGCMHILFNYSFRLYRSMSVRQRLYYFCLQQYYFTGVTTLLGVICLSLYFWFGVSSASIAIATFLPMYVAILVIMGVVDVWLQHLNIRPVKERGVMWGALLVGIAVRPIYLIAFLSLFKRKQLGYKVTPKGKHVKRAPSTLRLFAPHLVVAMVLLVAAASSLFTHRTAGVMLFWALVGGGSLLFVPYAESVGNYTARIASRVRNVAQPK